MAFRDELEALVDEIRVEAIHRYGWDNAGIIEVSLDQTRVFPASPDPYDDRNERFQQRLFEEYLSYVDELRDKFAEYYGLKTTQLVDIGHDLGGRDLPEDIGDLTPSRANTVCARLHYADAQWVTPLAEPIEQPESPTYRFGYWSGDAATAFNNEFLAPFRAASERQIAYTQLLNFAIETFRVGIKRMQDDLIEIATACRDELRSWRDGPFDAGGFFGVVSIVATAAGLIPGLNVAAVTVLGATSLASGVISMEAGSPTARGNQWQIEGEFGTDVISTTFDAIVAMLDKITEQDVAIASLLNEMAAASPGELVRPTVADCPTSFGVVDSTDADVVVAEVSEIYQAGYIDLPEAAAEYDRARDDLYGHMMPESVDIAFPFSAQPYRDARLNLNAALVSVRESLLDASAALVDVANTYTWTDQDSAAQFTQYKETLGPPPNQPDEISGRVY